MIECRKTKSEYYLTVASIITDKEVITKLINTGKQVVAPLMNTIESEDITNFWQNVTENSFEYSHSLYYDDIALHNYNGLWAVPVILNTFLLKINVVSEILFFFSDEKNLAPFFSDKKKFDCIQFDVTISQLIFQKFSFFPWLLNRRSYGHYIGDYTTNPTSLLLKKYHPPVWRANYLDLSPSLNQSFFHNPHHRKISHHRNNIFL